MTMKLIRNLITILALVASVTCARAQFWTIDGANWTASGLQSNHHSWGAQGLTNWIAIRSPNGPVMIDSAYLTGQTIPFTLSIYKTLQALTITATNMVNTNTLCVDATNMIPWQMTNKFALLYHASNDLWMRLVVTNYGTVTNWLPWGRKPVAVVSADYGSGVVYTNHSPLPGDRLYILDLQGRYLFTTNSGNIWGVTAGGGPAQELPLSIPAGTWVGDQAVMVVFSGVVGGAVDSMNTNELKLVRGRFLR